MKSSDIFIDIAVRAAAATPIEPSFTALPYEGGVDAFNALTGSLREEFPFLYAYKEELADADVAGFDGLFGWLVDQLRNFPDSTSDPERRLVDILALATLLEGGAELWGVLAQALPRLPPLLIDAIAKVFTDTRPACLEILERAHCSPTQISTALGDIARKDWKSVEQTMDKLRDWLWLPLKTHAAAALHQYDRARLKDLVERADDLFEVAAYVLHAPVAQTLALALPSKNWTFKFWALHNSARRAAAGEPPYPLEWEALLTQAAGESQEWARWLAVLNEYPSRYPQLQSPLGNALAGASEEALDAYVASLSLTENIGSPQSVAALCVFRTKASLPSRQRLWTTAFRRWETWDFGCNDESRSLLHVTRSSLDYAVMGYLIECVSDKARAEMCAELLRRAVAIERAWHPDVTSAMSERFKLISTYQLLAHAEAVLAGAPEWLGDGSLYRPVWEDGTTYRSLKYDPGMGTATF